MGNFSDILGWDHRETGSIYLEWASDCDICGENGNFLDLSAISTQPKFGIKTLWEDPLSRMESFPITMIYIGTILWKNRHRMTGINPELITANWDTPANNFCDRRLGIRTWWVMDLRWLWILFAAKKCSMKNILILNRKLYDDIFVDIRNFRIFIIRNFKILE